MFRLDIRCLSLHRLDASLAIQCRSNLPVWAEVFAVSWIHTSGISMESQNHMFTCFQRLPAFGKLMLAPSSQLGLCMTNPEVSFPPLYPSDPAPPRLSHPPALPTRSYSFFVLMKSFTQKLPPDTILLVRMSALPPCRCKILQRSGSCLFGTSHLYLSIVCNRICV